MSKTPKGFQSLRAETAFERRSNPADVNRDTNLPDQHGTVEVVVPCDGRKIDDKLSK